MAEQSRSGEETPIRRTLTPTQPGEGTAAATAVAEPEPETRPTAVEDEYVVLHVVLGRRLRMLTKAEIEALVDMPGIMKPTGVPREPFRRGDVVPKSELTAPSDGYDNIARLESIGAIVHKTDASSAARRQIEAEEYEGRFPPASDRDAAIMIRQVELEADRTMAMAQRRQQIVADRAARDRH